MKSLVLLSGGADSTLLILLAKKLNREIKAITFDYGQKLDEINPAIKLCKKYEVPHEVIKLPFTPKSKLTGYDTKYKAVSNHWVPARNTVFLSIALSIAEQEDINEIWIGSDYSDYKEFPDCRQEYISLFNKLCNFATSHKVEIKAPLLGLKKEDIIDLLNELGINKKEYFSGYGDLND